MGGGPGAGGWTRKPAARPLLDLNVRRRVEEPAADLCTSQFHSAQTEAVDTRSMSGFRVSECHILIFQVFIYLLLLFTVTFEHNYEVGPF